MVKFLILIQIGNIDYIDRIFKKVIKYNVISNLYHLSFDEQYRNIIHTIPIPFFNYHILFHKNKGMDIGPFILQMKWCIENYDINSFDKIYKIHTKTDKNWFDSLTDIDVSMTALNASKQWLRPIDVYNKETILYLCDTFNIPNIYYDDLKQITYNLKDLDINFYSTYYNLPLSTGNEKLNKEYLLLHAINNKHALNEDQIIIKHRKPNVCFVAGTIFIMDYNLLYTFFNSIDIMKLYCLLEEGYVINDRPTIVHALERIISSFFLTYDQ